MIGALFLSHTMYTMLNPNQRYMKTSNHLKKSLDFAQSQRNLLQQKQQKISDDDDETNAELKGDPDDESEPTQSLMKQILDCEDDENKENNEGDERLDQVGSLVNNRGSLESSTETMPNPKENLLVFKTSRLQSFGTSDGDAQEFNATFQSDRALLK